MSPLTIPVVVEIDSAETRVRVRLLDEIGTPRTAGEISAAALERAVCNRWGPRAFLHRDSGLPSYGQIFRSLGDNSAASITGRVHYRVNVPALPAAHLEALAEAREQVARGNHEDDAEERAGYADAESGRAAQIGRGYHYSIGYGNAKRDAEWRRDELAAQAVDSSATYRVAHKRTRQLWSSAYGWVWPGTAQEKEATLYDAEDARGPLPSLIASDGEWQLT